MERSFLWLSVIALVAGAAPAAAQMDWLTPHLDSQRWNNLREHQRGQQAKRTAPRPPAPRPMSPQHESDAWAAQREARKAQLRPEYERRVVTEGRESANRWLAEKAPELGRRDREAMQRMTDGEH